jgi:dTDP-glucose 4,6-dehydratase
VNIIITGGAGFIGSAVIKYFIENTAHVVINVDKLTYAGHLESLEKFENHPRYHFEQEDICNYLGIENIFDTYKPDAIMHLAAESHVDRSIDNAFDFIQTNIIGTHTLLEVSRKYWLGLSDPQKTSFRFHHISTDEVYGDLTLHEPAFTEDSHYDPSSPYSASKASSDHLVRAWHRTYGLPVIVTNCSNNYGPNQYIEKLIPLTIFNALEGNPIKIYGNGDNIRDWLYVNDHAEALGLVLFSGGVGQTYNIGGKNEKTNLEVVRTICHLLDELRPGSVKGKRSFIDLIEFVEDRPGHDFRYSINTQKIEESLNWKPKESFETGIRKTVEWYLENMDWCNRVMGKKYKGERLGTLGQCTKAKNQ